jgi:3-deoxy-D-manno-octulosonic-acid transferase
LGELGIFYRVCPIVFMGGSLILHGGQNPLEAARLGACVTIGPHHWNQAEAVAKLGLPIANDGPDLARIIGRWLDAPDQRALEAAAQMAKARALGGAVEASLKALQPILSAAGIHV